MNSVLAIDPGPEKSAWIVLYDGLPLGFGIEYNQKMRHMLKRKECYVPDKMVIEMIASYGMPVGKSVFETCVWIGRFIEVWNESWEFMYRKDVKLHLCNSMKAKDSNIRQALLDRFPATGGGKTPQIGIKSKPGPLYGISKDVWAALAVAVTWTDKNKG